MEREQWLNEAEAAEKSSSVRTAQVIVRETIGLGVEPEDRKV
jgi:pre-mRNA-processing factor 6